MDVLILIVVGGIALFVGLPLLNALITPMHKLGVSRLKQCLAQRRIDPSQFSDACLKELAQLGDGPVSLPGHLGVFQRRARYSQNIDGIASGVALTLRGQNPYANDDDPMIRVLKKHGMLPQS